MTLLDRARAMLNPMGNAENRFWAKEVSKESYIKYRMFSSAFQSIGETPYEALTGIKPDLSNTREFG